jgi:glycosyltransferase involved in cell wall biosynthesis
VLISLSGNDIKARDLLSLLFPEAQLYVLSRTILDSGGFAERLRRLRSERPDIFAVVTESLDWQFGQDALMLFGALGGAKTSLIIDSRGRHRKADRSKLFARAPLQIGRAFLRGKAALARAHRELRRLETLVGAGVANEARTRSDNETIRVDYLRAIPAAGTQPGGATTHINGVVNGLIDLGVDVTFISNDRIASLDESSLHFRLIPPDTNVMPRAAFDVHNAMLFSDAAADIVAADKPHFIYQRYCRFSWAGVEAGIRAQVPLFLEYNGSEVWIGKNWDSTEQLELLERCERLNLNAATRIFVISEVERNNLVKAGIAPEKIIVNPNGVDTEVFRPGIGGGAERADFGIPSDKVLVGFVGTFGPWHGVLALAEAIALVPKDAGMHFLLIGDGSLKPDVHERLRASGDLNRVTFAGIVSHERVPRLLDACDILVSPHVPLADGSEFFGSPTKLFEYMAMGKGIVASRLGQIGDVLTDNETALLVEPANVAELSDAIAKMAGDQDLRMRLGTAARQAALQNHTWLRNGARLLEALNH